MSSNQLEERSIASLILSGPAHPAGRDPEVLCEFHKETRVTFSELSEALVREYVDSGEPA